MYLNPDQLRLVLLVIEWIEHLPEPIQSEAAAEIESLWQLHEAIQSHKDKP